MHEVHGAKGLQKVSRHQCQIFREYTYHLEALEDYTQNHRSIGLPNVRSVEPIGTSYLEGRYLFVPIDVFVGPTQPNNTRSSSRKHLMTQHQRKKTTAASTHRALLFLTKYIILFTVNSMKTGPQL